jgi:predicted nucleotidyltransferase
MADLRTELASAVRDMPGVVSLYLFGSVAEGREHLESDVDVGVLLDRAVYPTERDRFDRRLLLGTALRDAARREADVVILNDAPPTLARAIVTRGERIVCRDAELDHAFVRDAQLLAADIDPWLRRMRAIKLAAGERR